MAVLRAAAFDSRVLRSSTGPLSGGSAKGSEFAESNDTRGTSSSLSVIVGGRWARPVLGMLLLLGVASNSIGPRWLLELESVL